MLGWFIVLVPTAIIIINIILSIVLEYNRDEYRIANVRGVSEPPYKFSKVLRFLYDCESKVSGATTVSIVCIIIIAIAMLCSHMETRGFIAKYEGVAAEYKIRSDTFSMPERVAAFNYAMSLTAEASVFQYWNKHFDPFVPDRVDQLKPIR